MVTITLAMELAERAQAAEAEVERLKARNASLVERHNALTDELNRVHPDRILYGRIPTKEDLYFQ